VLHDRIQPAAAASGENFSIYPNSSEGSFSVAGNLNSDGHFELFNLFEKPMTFAFQRMGILHRLTSIGEGFSL
jgi:hypothetical protein